jgi:hypothetical protein
MSLNSSISNIIEESGLVSKESTIASFVMNVGGLDSEGIGSIKSVPIRAVVVFLIPAGPTNITYI